MGAGIYPVLERPIEGMDGGSGKALARVVEAHRALSPLMDFYSIDPAEIAIEVGMVYPYEEGGAEDLNEIDFGPAEWFEPAVGLAAVRRALMEIRKNPQSIDEAIYDPRLRASDVITDLEAIEQALLQAQQRETRFHFAIDDKN